MRRTLENKWRPSLIGYVLGDTPYVKSMENYVENEYFWNFITKPKILYHDDDYYIFRFDFISNRNRVMLSSPYTYHNKPFILKN